jgi:hypothetical protein
VCWFPGPVALQWLCGLGQLQYLSRGHVFIVVFILFEPLSPSRIFFIGSHSLPPLRFAVSVLQEGNGDAPALCVESSECEVPFIGKEGRLSAWDQDQRCGQIKRCSRPYNPLPLTLDTPDHCF